MKSETEYATKLPTWHEASAAVDRGNPTALEQFIYDNEPAGKVAAKDFRDSLAAVWAEAEGS